jgi:hypothetical protein
VSDFTERYLPYSKCADHVEHGYTISFVTPLSFIMCVCVSSLLGKLCVSSIHQNAVKIIPEQPIPLSTKLNEDVTNFRASAHCWEWARAHFSLCVCDS